MSQTNSIVFEGIEVNGSIRGNGKHYSDDSDAEEVDEEAGQDPSTSTLGRLTDRFGFFRPDLDEADSFKVSAEQLRKREAKWIHMLENWPSFMNKNFEKVRDRCRKGVPPAIRGRVWKFLCGAQYMMTSPKNTIQFATLDAHAGYASANDDIVKDLHRQFPTHELFARDGGYGKFGQEDLFRILKAWAVLHPEEGYCQGQAPIAATLLMHMPVADAFYCFVQICHKYLPGYYSPGLEAIQLDGDILYGLLKKFSPVAYRHLKKQNIDPVLYMVEWFMCVYCRSLPWSTVLRVWDMFFCEGVKVLFKVAIVLLQHTLGKSKLLKDCPSMYETVEKLRNIPAAIVQEDFLVRKVVELDLTEELLEREHFKRVKQRKQKLQGSQSSGGQNR